MPGRRHVHPVRMLRPAPSQPDDGTADDALARGGFPLAEVVTHPFDRPQSHSQHPEQLGQLGGRIPRPSPPRPVHEAGGRSRRLQPQAKSTAPTVDGNGWRSVNGVRIADDMSVLQSPGLFTVRCGPSSGTTQARTPTSDVLPTTPTLLFVGSLPTCALRRSGEVCEPRRADPRRGERTRGARSSGEVVTDLLPRARPSVQDGAMTDDPLVAKIAAARRDPEHAPVRRRPPGPHRRRINELCAALGVLARPPAGRRLDHAAGHGCPWSSPPWRPAPARRSRTAPTVTWATRRRPRGAGRPPSAGGPGADRVAVHPARAGRRGGRVPVGCGRGRPPGAGRGPAPSGRRVRDHPGAPGRPRNATVCGRVRRRRGMGPSGRRSADGCRRGGPPSRLDNHATRGVADADDRHCDGMASRG